MAGCRIGVLADDEDADGVQGLLEGSEDMPTGREIAATFGHLGPEEITECCDRRCHRRESLRPRGVHELVQRGGRHDPNLRRLMDEAPILLSGFLDWAG